MTKRQQLAITLDGCPTCPFADPPTETVHPVVQVAVVGGALVGALSLGAMIVSAFRPLAVERRPPRTGHRRRVKMIRVGR